MIFGIIFCTQKEDPGSVKLTASLPLKMDGWKMILSFWDGSFSGAIWLVSRRVFKKWRHNFLGEKCMKELFFVFC